MAVGEGGKWAGGRSGHVGVALVVGGCSGDIIGNIDGKGNSTGVGGGGKPAGYGGWKTRDREVVCFIILSAGIGHELAVSIWVGIDFIVDFRCCGIEVW